MHKRLYILGSLFAISALICLSTAFSNDKILDVHYNQLTKDAQKQVDCLAQNIYHTSEKFNMRKIGQMRGIRGNRGKLKQRVMYNNTCEDIL